jgi:GH24 family phage-related lysozyme (muramidase)
MRSDVRLSFPAFTRKYESYLRFLYLDVKCLVTTGLGNLMEPIACAYEITWVHPDGTRATNADVDHAWHTVKSHPEMAVHGGNDFQFLPGNEIRATEDSINALVDRKMNSIDAALRRLFPTWEAWPAECQTATLSMAWAMGVGRIMSAFPHFMAACMRHDWLTASAESHMSEVGQNPSFIARNAANKALFLTAVYPSQMP